MKVEPDDDPVPLPSAINHDSVKSLPVALLIEHTTSPEALHGLSLEDAWVVDAVEVANI